MILIKNADEIEKMRKAGKVVAQVLSMLEKAAVPGVTTAQLNGIAEEETKKRGAIPVFKNYPHPHRGKPFPGVICASVNEEVVHGIPGDRVLQDGDIISIDFGVLLDGYAGDSALTVGIGQVNPQAMKLIQVTEQSLMKGIEKAQMGKKLGDVSHAIQKFVEDQGFSVVRDYVGHGIGRQMHEDPPVPNYGKPNWGSVLKPGMAIAIEPMVNMGTHCVYTLADQWTVRTRDGLPSAHFEHSIAITDHGPEILTLR
ncbi:MAG: type I methionyl aminopeptidase [Bacillota bacterium]|nr:type I methionyl aminopeptidase [Bacillota bacterium]